MSSEFYNIFQSKFIIIILTKFTTNDDKSKNYCLKFEYLRNIEMLPSNFSYAEKCNFSGTYVGGIGGFDNVLDDERLLSAVVNVITRWRTDPFFITLLPPLPFTDDVLKLCCIGVVEDVIVMDG
jgi:hypothetical protein